MTGYNISNWTKADDAMVEDAIRRGATRRDLLKMLAVGGVATLAGGTILGRATAALAATPVMGGAIKVAGYTSSTADTLDPAKAANQTDYCRCSAFYNRLTYLGEGGKLHMELAETVESADAQVWTIKLRKGVTFHDGKTLTASDVVYSLQRHLDPAVGSKANAIAKQMTGIRAVDSETIEITLVSANADLPILLALHQFMIIADGTTDFSKANGTGAFVCEVFEPGVKSIAVRNPNYWKSTGPYLDSFEFFAIPDDTARVNAVLSGDVQLAGSISPRSVRLLENQGTAGIFASTSGNYTNLNMRLDMDPGSKADFVTGMKYLLDRELIQKSILRGMAEIGNDQPISSASFYHNADLKPKAYDPEKAKYHFEKAGLLGQSVPIVASDAASSSVDMATVIQQAGAEIGMKFDIDRVPSDGYWSNYWIKAPIHFGNINPRPTPDTLFSLFYASDAAWNESGFKSEKFDKMLIEARGLLDQEKRKEIYGEMQVMISEDAGTAIPVYISDVAAHSPKLHGLKPNPLGALMGYAFAEYVWMDS
ncbi:ABC transporter substrate-binding protein [Thalassospira sp.]|uniref:ABC transporter substrate-binding protein n=1 Tax=Thalassospira sp. TaxID=1912094 RepID=UPI0027341E0D|nr:ABC transporter substrate-binding protein [Thalassospira sp.]MDP2699843.1 ABC transporter substrate-binding protein [Thalassospira sp.]